MVLMGILFLALLLTFQKGVAGGSTTTTCSGTSSPTLRTDDPALEVITQKNWTRPSHCPNNLRDNLTTTHNETGWKIDEISVSVEGMEDRKVKFIIDNKTPRDFETLKLRVNLTAANSAPIDLEVGQIVQFTKYRFKKAIQGVGKKEDIESVKAIEGMHMYKIGIRNFRSTCSTRKYFTFVTVQHEKNYAHSIANIHYLVNSPEFRKDFLVSHTLGTGWMERQRHLDWILTAKKYELTFGTMCKCTGNGGSGSTVLITVAEQFHDEYSRNIISEIDFSSMAEIMSHELYHAWSYGHSDFALLMETPMVNQLKKFNQQCVVQPKIAPQERYTDFVGLNAVYNSVEQSVYIFSGYTFRIISMKEWNETNAVNKHECLSKDPVTGRVCVNFGSSACRFGEQFNKNTTVFGNPCKKLSNCTAQWKGVGCYEESNEFTFCYPPCSWKTFGTETYKTSMPIYGAHGQVDVESVRHCVRFDESCAWNKAENCKRYGAYSGRKATTIGGEACMPWKDTDHKNFEGNYCRTSHDKGPWCYKASGGWDYCFSQCKITPADYQSPIIPESDKACFNSGKGCAWNLFHKCKSESKMYEQTTTRLGEACKTGTKCRSGNGLAPRCFKQSKPTEWDYCFPDCLVDLCLRDNGNCFLGQEPFCQHYLGDQVFKKTTTVDGRKCDSTHNGGRCVTKKNDPSLPWCIVNTKKEKCYKICTRHSCLKADKSCAWNMRDICKSDTAAARYTGTYAGSKNTTHSGVVCNSGPPNFENTTCKSVREGYIVYAPSCSFVKYNRRGFDLMRESCFKDCYEPSQDERSLVEKVYKDVKMGIKFAFLDTSGPEQQIGIVPFVRGQKPDQDRIFYYSLDQKSLTLKQNKSLKNVLGGLWGPGRTLYNPQFLQEVGVFHGAQFCNFTGGSVGACTNVFTDPKWAFLKKFAAGPAELDLVFDGGHGKFFFFKEREFIVYDMNKKKMVDGYPKMVSVFLHQFGLHGRSFMALS